MGNVFGIDSVVGMRLPGHLRMDHLSLCPLDRLPALAQIQGFLGRT